MAAKNKRAAPSPAKPFLKRNGKKVLTTKPSPSPTIRQPPKHVVFTSDLRSRGLKVSGVKLQEDENRKKFKKLVPTNSSKRPSAKTTGDDPEISDVSGEKDAPDPDETTQTA